MGVLRAKRWGFSIPPYVHEFLLFTPDRVVVARQLTKFPYHTMGAHSDVGDILAALLKSVKVEDILKSDKHNFEIPNSEITKVELRKSWGGQDAVYPQGVLRERNTVKSKKSLEWFDLNIITSEKKYKWNVLGIPEKKDVEFEDYKNILRPVFGDKLSVIRVLSGSGPLFAPP